MRIGSTRRRAALGIAAGGVLAGHALTYALLDPNAHQRAAELAGTGHAYLGLANDLGLVVGLVGLSAVFLSGLTRRGDVPPSIGGLMGRLVGFQVAAFVTMEILERLSTGAPLAGLLHHAILPVGVLIQAAVAGLGALVIAWLLRAAEHIESVLGAAATLSDGAEGSVALPMFKAPGRPSLAAAGIRGPPLLASPR